MLSLLIAALFYIAFLILAYGLVAKILQYKNTEIRTKPYLKKLNQKIDKYNLYVDHLKNLDKENKLDDIINLITDKIFLPGTIDKTMYDVLNKSTITNIRNILRKGSKHDYTNIYCEHKIVRASEGATWVQYRNTPPRIKARQPMSPSELAWIRPQIWQIPSKLETENKLKFKR